MPPDHRCEPAETSLREVRCKACNRLLFKASAAGRVEVVCYGRDCRRMQTVTLEDRRV